MSNHPVPADFKSFIALHKDTVYGKICDYMPSGGPSQYYKMVRSYVDRKGQYRRPSYVLLWSLLYGGKVEEAVLPAAAQQLSEDYFLMHDDWMDSNSLRRGGPTAHVMYGPRYAVLAGDHVQNILWKVAKDASDQLGPERGKRFFDKFFDMMHVTHEGQYLDISLTDHKDITQFTLDDYFRSIHAKSAYYSVYGPMQLGAIVAGAPEHVIQQMPLYGIPAGNAFQIKDDILDCSSTEAILGKSIGNDVRDGTKTLILWHAVQNAPADVREKLVAIYAKPREEKSEDEIQWVLKQFKELGSLDYAQAEAIRLSDEAAKKFDELTKDVPESGWKHLARESIGYAAKRTH